ncbi:serine/threonine-protein phosphatase 7 long form homolog [Gastrolobium bilobum]|uniref:serine/threonine-protein phosphatase 7 long form homolog n=1 Tax=Gastrolobium bilobum TaxID=150636 RepID=UPI002AB318DE|nr:serine/threonine-protein phosphatase 7 long form homolog [Gastrolobium bilobum]
MEQEKSVGVEAQVKEYKEKRPFDHADVSFQMYHRNDFEVKCIAGIMHNDAVDNVPFSVAFCSKPRYMQQKSRDNRFMAREVINPGPEDYSVLRIDVQETHVSQVVWNSGLQRVLKVRRATHGKESDPHDPDHIPEPVVEHLRRAGFYHVARMHHMPIDHSLISALVERWRPETHTFHMPQGEVTITLQDVNAILGLSSDGEPLIGPTSANWSNVVQQMLGHQPLPHEIEGSYLRMSFIDRHYGHWVAHQGMPHTELLYSRAYILRLIGGFLFSDKSGNKVALRFLPFLDGDFSGMTTYSWGAAVLALLYRELCMATNPAQNIMSGCLTLLQIWAWSRFPPIAPFIPPETDPNDHYERRFNNFPRRIRPKDLMHYRSTLDTMSRTDVGVCTWL